MGSLSLFVAGVDYRISLSCKRSKINGKGKCIPRLSCFREMG